MRIMKNTTTMSIIAIVALSGLLIAASALGPATDAFAKKHKKYHSDKHHNGSSQSARSDINQSNIQRSVCISGGSTSGSCNNSAANVNRGNAVSANVGNGGNGDGSSQHASSDINQGNDQSSVVISGGNTIDSGNNAAANVNFGNAVSANVG